MAPHLEGKGALGRLAVGAAPEQLEAVVVDAVAGPTLDVADDGTPPGVVDIVTPTARRADDVVVMGRFTRHVGMFATGQVDPLHGVYLGEQVERPEDRRPTDPESTLAGVGHEIGGGEVCRPSRDQLGDRAPGIRRSIAGVVESGADGTRVGHCT